MPKDEKICEQLIKTVYDPYPIIVNIRQNVGDVDFRILCADFL